MTARDQLEPAALDPSAEPDMPPSEREIEQSKAISLKRIADALEQQNEPLVTGEVIEGTLERLRSLRV